ncbi:hypothetical protein L7O53_22635, partial [Pseudomonas sp. CMAA1741]|nr:hypothetical protein [Pseudomonas sp. CMAA1741]
MLVYVPPPPSMTVRNPTTQEMRHHIDGLKGTAPLEELKFEAGTLLVIEVKTTLGKTRTPSFLETQRVGGSRNLRRIQELIAKDKGAWQLDKLQKHDPGFTSKAGATMTATASGKVEFLHAQVFFDSSGKLNPLTHALSGIQINNWK